MMAILNRLGNFEPKLCYNPGTVRKVIQLKTVLCILLHHRLKPTMKIGNR